MLVRRIRHPYITMACIGVEIQNRL